jgi:hypothetical protein
MEMAMGSYAKKCGQNRPMNRLALSLVALCLMGSGTTLSKTNKVLPGEPIMTQSNTHSNMDTLEKFNQPENFLATRTTFDRAMFKKNAGNSDKYQYVREDGIHIRQFYLGNNGYKEELTRPDSFYEYSNGYMKDGRLESMVVRFFRYPVGEVLYFDEKGKIVKRRNMDIEGSFLPIEKLRERFLDEKKIDIYDKKIIVTVYRARHEGYGGKTYYDIYVRHAPGSVDLTSYLLDGATGEILFKTFTTDTDGGMKSAYKKYKEHLQSNEGKP